MSQERDAVDWHSVVLVVVSGVVVALHIGKMASALPQMITEMQLSLVVAGWLVAGVCATAAILGLVMGRLVDRFGPRKLLLMGLVLSALGSALGALSWQWWLLLISRVVEGLGLLWVVISAPTLLAQRLNEHYRARVMGWWGCFMPAGTGLSIFFSPLLLPVIGWRGMWWVIAALSLLMAVLVHRQVTADEKAERIEVTATGGIGRVLRTLGLALVGLCFGLYAFQYSATLQFIPLWLGEERGVSLFAASMIAVLFCVANIGGNLLSGRLMLQGWQPQRILLLCSLGMAVLSLPIFREGFPDMLRLCALLIFPVIGGLIPPAAFTLVPRLSPSPQLMASSNGWVVQLLNVGMFLGAPVQAAVVSAHGWPAASWVLLPAALISAVFAWVLGRMIAGE